MHRLPSSRKQVSRVSQPMVYLFQQCFHSKSKIVLRKENIANGSSSSDYTKTGKRFCGYAGVLVGCRSGVADHASNIFGSQNPYPRSYTTFQAPFIMSSIQLNANSSFALKMATYIIEYETLCMGICETRTQAGWLFITYAF